MQYNLIGNWKTLHDTTYGEWTEHILSVQEGQTFQVIDVLEGDMIIVRNGHTTTESTVIY
jgi:hypothetical protein